MSPEELDRRLAAIEAQVAQASRRQGWGLLLSLGALGLVAWQAYRREQEPDAVLVLADCSPPTS